MKHEDQEFDGNCPTCWQAYAGRELESLRESNARLAELCTNYAAEVHKLREQLKRCVAPYRHEGRKRDGKGGYEQD